MAEVLVCILDNKSDVLAIVSIILGILALIQSYKYNRDSGKIMKDIKLMLSQQQVISKKIMENLDIKNENPNITRNTSSIRLRKDKICLHKLCQYNKQDAENIMDVLRHLIIKKRFLDKIENYLKSDDIDFDCNFWGKAESDGEVDISKIYGILLKYNILAIIDYN